MEAQVPDAVLLDVMMPEISGIDVLKRMRGSAATARVSRHSRHRQGAGRGST
jgi:DNA-binding response OmpR family regulator